MSIVVVVENGIGQEYHSCDGCGVRVFNASVFPAANMLPATWKEVDVRESGLLIRKHYCSSCKSGVEKF